MRLIDADFLAKTIEKAQMESRNVNVLSLIHDAPTIEPFEKIGAICNENCGGYRPKGKWIETDRFDEIADYMLKCPKCNEDTLSSHGNYCPNCGARLE